MKDVALVLSSGGPRGFAYIGAIEELLGRGYRITSVAGTSIGSLIGGMYAAGKLEEVKDWLFTLNGWKVFTLMDLSISRNHLVKGERVIGALREIVPDVNIEDLGLPYKAIATDLFTGEEVIFSQGNLFQAIRASISIPSLFRPVKIGSRTLIDGGIANTMPLNRVVRNGHDILVAFNVNDVDVAGIREFIQAEEDEREAEEAAQMRRQAVAARRQAERALVLDSMLHNDNLTFVEKLRLAGMHGYKVVREALEREEARTQTREGASGWASREASGEGTREGSREGSRDAERFETFRDPEANYFTILSRTFDLMNHVNSKMMAQMYPPDILVNMPFDSFGAISDYARAEEICEEGRRLMREALDSYEGS